MDWAASEWKDGLNGLARKKVEDLEEQLAKHQKMNQQKQLQNEQLEQALANQKKKTEEEKSLNAQLTRNIQTLCEQEQGLRNKNEKLQHDIQSKENQLNCLEGQLTSKKNLQATVQLSTSQMEELQFENRDLKVKCMRLEQERKLSGSQDSSFSLDKIGTPARARQTSKSEDELERLRFQNDLLSSQVKDFEQKVKNLSKERECDRHNQEATRVALEAKYKEKENSYQEEIRNQSQAAAQFSKMLEETKTKLQQEVNKCVVLETLKVQTERDSVNLQAAEKEKREQHQLIQDKDNKLIELENSLAEMKKAIQHYETKQENSQLKVDTAEAKVSQLEKELKTAQSEVCSFRKELEKLEPYEEKNKKLAELLSTMEHRFSEKENSCKALNSEVVSLKTTVEQQLVLENDLKREKSEFLQQLQSKEKEHIENSSKLERLNKLLSEKEKNVTLLEDKVAKSTLTSQDKDNEIFQLQESLKEKNSQLHVLNEDKSKEVSSLKDQLVRMQNMLTVKEQEVARKAQELLTSAQDVTALQQSLVSTQEENKKMQHQLDEKEKTVAVLGQYENKLSEAEALLEQANNNLSSFKITFKELEDHTSVELASRDTRLTEKTSEVSLLKKELALQNEKMQAMQMQLTLKDQSLDKMELNVSNLKESVAELMKGKEMLENRIKEKCSLLLEAETKLKWFQKMEESFKMQILELQVKLQESSEKNQELDVLVAEKNQLKYTSETLQQDVYALKQVNSEMQENETYFKNQVSELQLKLQDSLTKYERFNELLAGKDQLKTANEVLQQEIATLKELNSEMLENETSYENQISEMQLKLQEYLPKYKEFDKLAAEKDEMKTTNDMLQQEITSLKLVSSEFAEKEASFKKEFSEMHSRLEESMSKLERFDALVAEKDQLKTTSDSLQLEISSLKEINSENKEALEDFSERYKSLEVSKIKEMEMLRSELTAEAEKLYQNIVLKLADEETKYSDLLEEFNSQRESYVALQKESNNLKLDLEETVKKERNDFSCLKDMLLEKEQKILEDLEAKNSYILQLEQKLENVASEQLLGLKQENEKLLSQISILKSQTDKLEKKRETDYEENRLATDILNQTILEKDTLIEKLNCSVKLAEENLAQNCELLQKNEEELQTAVSRHAEQNSSLERKVRNLEEELEKVYESNTDLLTDLQSKENTINTVGSNLETVEQKLVCNLNLINSIHNSVAGIHSILFPDDSFSTDSFDPDFFLMMLEKLKTEIVSREYLIKQMNEKNPLRSRERNLSSLCILDSLLVQLEGLKTTLGQKAAQIHVAAEEVKPSTGVDNETNLADISDELLTNDADLVIRLSEYMDFIIESIKRFPTSGSTPLEEMDQIRQNLSSLKEENNTLQLNFDTATTVSNDLKLKIGKFRENVLHILEFSSEENYDFDQLLEKMTNKFQTMEADYRNKAATAKHLQETVDEVEGYLQNTFAEKKKLEEELEAVQQRYFLASDDALKLEETLTKLKDEFVQLEHSNTEKTAQLNMFELGRNELIVRLEEKQNAVVQKLEKEIENKSEECQKLFNTLQHNEKLLAEQYLLFSSLTDESASANRNCSILGEELKLLKEELLQKTFDFEKLEVVLQEKLEQTKELEGNLVLCSKAKEENKALENEIEALKKNTINDNELKSRIELFSKVICTLLGISYEENRTHDQLLEELTTRFVIIQTDCKRAVETAGSLQRTVDEVESYLQNAFEEKRKLENELKKLQEKNSVASDEALKSEEALKMLRDEILQLDHSCTELKEYIAALESEKAELKLKLEERNSEAVMKLEKDVKDKIEEGENLLSSLQQSETLLQEQRQLVSSLTKESSDARSKCSVLEDELVFCKEQLSQKMCDLSKLKELVDVHSHHTKELEEELLLFDKAKEENESLRNKIGSLTEAAKRFVDYDMHMTEYKDLKVDNENLKSTLDNLSRDNKVLQNRCEETQGLYDQMILDYKTVSEEKQLLEEELNSVKNENGSVPLLIEENKNLKSSLEILQGNLENLNSKLIQAKEKLHKKSVVLEMTEQKNIELVESASKLNVLVESWKTRQQKMLSSLDMVHLDLEKDLHIDDLLQLAIEKAKTRILDQECLITQLKEEMTEETAKTTGAVKQYSDVVKKYSELETQNEFLNREVMKLRKDLNETLHQLENVKGELQDVKRRYDDLQFNLDETELNVEELKQNSDIQSTLYEKKIEKITLDLMQSNECCTKFEKELSTLQSELQVTKKQKEDKSTEAENYFKEIDTLHKRVASLEETDSNRLRELEAQTKDMEEVKEKRKEFQQKLEQVKRDYESAKSKIHLLNRNARKREDLMLKMQAELEKSETLEKSLKEEIKGHKDKLQELEEKMTELENRCKEKDEELAKLWEQHGHVSAKIMECESSKKLLQEQLQATQNKPPESRRRLKFNSLMTSPEAPTLTSNSRSGKSLRTPPSPVLASDNPNKGIITRVEGSTLITRSRTRSRELQNADPKVSDPSDTCKKARLQNQSKASSIVMDNPTDVTKKTVKAFKSGFTGYPEYSTASSVAASKSGLDSIMRRPLALSREGNYGATSDVSKFPYSRRTRRNSREGPSDCAQQ